MSKAYRRVFMRPYSVAVLFGCLLLVIMGGLASMCPRAYAQEAANVPHILEMQDKATIGDVRAMIQGLSANPVSYTADDLERVESIKAAFDSLDPADQAKLDAEESHPETAQSLGRVLEAALWSVWSYRPIDNSTSLPDGEYTSRSIPTLESSYSKGKSTSSRQRPWSVKSVTVKDGKATATIAVESETYPSLWMGGVTYPQTNESGNCEFEGVPIDLNSTFYFAGVSSSMPVPIAFSLTTSIEESEDAEPLTTAKQLIAKLPSDPDSITEEHKSAIDAATEAYEALSADERELLDKTSLPNENVTYGRYLESAQWGYAAQQPIDNTLAVVDGDYSQYVTSSSSMGKSTSPRARSWSIVKLDVSGEKATAVVRCNTASAFTNMRVGGVDYKANAVDGVPEFTVPVALNTTYAFTIDANDVADSIAYQMTTAIPLEPATITAIASASSKAAAALSGDWSAYEDASVTSITNAANALASAAAKEGVTEVELNAMAAALDIAVAGAVKKPVADNSGDSGNSNDSGSSNVTRDTGNTEPALASATKSSNGKKNKKNKKNKSGSSSSSKTSSSSTSTSTTVTGTSKSQTVPSTTTTTTTSTTTTATSTSSGTTSTSTSTSNGGSTSTSTSTSSTSATDSASPATLSAESAPPVADSASATGAVPEQSASSDTGVSSTPPASIREVSMSDDSDEGSPALVIAGGGVVALVLIGMVARTFLFVRAKDIA